MLLLSFETIVDAATSVGATGIVDAFIIIIVIPYIFLVVLGLLLQIESIFRI